MMQLKPGNESRKFLYYSLHSRQHLKYDLLLLPRNFQLWFYDSEWWRCHLTESGRGFP